MLKIEICNAAIGRVGSTAFIDSIDEQSQEAVVCKKFFSMVAKKEMRQSFFPSFTRIEPLSLVAEEPNDKWLFAYAYPGNCARFRVVELMDGLVPQDGFWRSPVAITHFIPFTRGIHNNQEVIFTNQEEAIGLYQEYLDEAEDIRDDLGSVIAWGLAAEIAMPLGSSQAVRSDALQMHTMERSQITATELNERATEQREAEAIAIRGPY